MEISETRADIILCNYRLCGLAWYLRITLPYTSIFSEKAAW